MGTLRGMQVTIDAKWLHAGWDWFVGVLAENLSDRECRDLLRPGNLDWKVGSSRQVDLIFQHGIPGVLQKELTQPPRALPARQGWIFYEVERDPAQRRLERRAGHPDPGPAVQGGADQQSGPACRDSRNWRCWRTGKRSLLQFALFAVPPRQT